MSPLPDETGLGPANEGLALLILTKCVISEHTVPIAETGKLLMDHCAQSHPALALVIFIRCCDGSGNRTIFSLSSTQPAVFYAAKLMARSADILCMGNPAYQIQK